MTDLDRRFGDLKGEPGVMLAVTRGATIQEAADAGGVGERTVRRRLADPSYRAEIHKLRARVLDEALGRLYEASTKAVGTLLDLMDTGPPTVRLGAVKLLLENLVSLSENLETRARIQALEQTIFSKDGDIAVRREVNVTHG